MKINIKNNYSITVLCKKIQIDIKRDIAFYHWHATVIRVWPQSDAELMLYGNSFSISYSSYSRESNSKTRQFHGEIQFSLVN